MSEKHMWLVYDLSFGGDYDALFTFLDQNRAAECGEGVAYFAYSYQEDLIKELQKDLESAFRPGKDRAYVMYNNNGKMRGKWIFGNRKKAPWSGYALADADTADDEA